MRLFAIQKGYSPQSNRADKGILQFHCHEVALYITEHGTSKRRYGQVRLVEVPEYARSQVLGENRERADLTPLLSNFDAVCHNGYIANKWLYCCLSCTHFVEAHKLILEGGRRFMDQSDGLRFELVNWDCEGRLIQSQGVVATVYSAKLWEDNDALLALMHESNYDESEAFQIV